MASPSKTGETPSAAICGPRILDVVTSATVEEPNDALKICVNMNASKNI